MFWHKVSFILPYVIFFSEKEIWIVLCRLLPNAWLSWWECDITFKGIVFSFLSQIPLIPPPSIYFRTKNLNTNLTAVCHLTFKNYFKTLELSPLSTVNMCLGIGPQTWLQTQPTHPIWVCLFVCLFCFVFNLKVTNINLFGHLEDFWIKSAAASESNMRKEKAMLNSSEKCLRPEMPTTVALGFQQVLTISRKLTCRSKTFLIVSVASLFLLPYLWLYLHQPDTGIKGDPVKRERTHSLQTPHTSMLLKQVVWLVVHFFIQNHPSKSTSLLKHHA